MRVKPCAIRAEGGTQRAHARLQRARKIIAESGFTGLFEALKRGVALPAAAFVPLVQLLAQSEEVNRGE